MNTVTINGKEYQIPKVDFEAICALEENGVYLLNMDQKNPKLATMIRGLVAWIMDVSSEEASQEIQAHIQNGGDLVGIMTSVTQAVQNSGFFRRSGDTNTEDKVTEMPQNREQRRKQNRNNTRR